MESKSCPKIVQTSDVYSFKIIAYKFFANSYSYPDLNGEHLIRKIMQGLRPNVDKTKIPQLLKDLIKRCWDADPLKRPTAKELSKISNSIST